MLQHRAVIRSPLCRGAFPGMTLSRFIKSPVDQQIDSFQILAAMNSYCNDSCTSCLRSEVFFSLGKV